MINKLVILTALILTASVLHAGAEDYQKLTIEPGNYEFTESSSSSQSGEPREKKITKCINESILDPAGQMADRPGCTLSNYKSDDNKVSFDYSCDKGKGVKTSGSVEFSGSGKEFSWKKTVRTDITDEQNITVNGVGKAVRVGECTEK